jgi:hypothetical protein
MEPIMKNTVNIYDYEEIHREWECGGFIKYKTPKSKSKPKK